MNHVRFVIEAATDQNVWVVDVTPVSSVVDLSAPANAGLKDAIVKGLNLLIDAEPVPVFYRGTNQGTGIVDPNATTAGNPDNQAGIIPANTRLAGAYHFKQDTNAIIVATATGSGHLRFTRL